eukprot:g18329.t1
MKHHLSRLNGGDFIRGGVCNFDACPSISPQNLCPLERSVRFMSIEECEAFASFNYCRLSGSTRNRPKLGIQEIWAKVEDSFNTFEAIEAFLTWEGNFLALVSDGVHKRGAHLTNKQCGRIASGQEAGEPQG